MANQDQVLMENIKNPSLKRYFTPASARQQTRKWRIVSESVAQEVKKKADVKVAAGKTANPVTAPEKSTDDSGSEFATISDEKETLQKEYEQLSGTKPDGRWNEAKLKAKIETLKPTGL
ncbi:MAG TPA: hypothetical protein VFD46_08480 [Chryseolinea sp.]|nr:hypothetical protein [Chryseolinea sp.]